MKIISCPWEINNIGKSTAEIIVSREDSSDDLFSKLEELTQTYQYVVVKVPMKRIDINAGLSRNGFLLIEMQITVQKNVNLKEIVNEYYDDISFEELQINGDIERIVGSITPDMFSTDRITLDSHFGPNIGMKRYVNWIESEFRSQRSRFVIVKYKTHDIGFMMFRVENGVFQLLLNGLYKQWQGRHMGIITPSSPQMFIQKQRIDAQTIVTSISSNNVPVVKLYSRLGFEVCGQTYVYIKHNESE